MALYSRNHNSFNARFAPIVEFLSRLGHEAVLDGEVVVVDDQGVSHFQLLQNYQKTGKGRLHYYVFDLLSLDGSDLRGLPLRRRKELLSSILGNVPAVLLSEHVEDHGAAFFEAVQSRGLEGIIAKDADSPYREGRRGPDWLKIKTGHRQEAVIGGFTEPRGHRKDIGALVLGVFEGANFVTSVMPAADSIRKDSPTCAPGSTRSSAVRVHSRTDRGRTLRFTGCSRNSFAKCAFRTGRRRG